MRLSSCRVVWVFQFVEVVACRSFPDVFDEVLKRVLAQVNANDRKCNLSLQAQHFRAVEWQAQDFKGVLANRICSE